MKEIGELPCRHKVLFIDACRSELDDDGAKAAGASAGIGVKELSREGLATFFSCDPRDRSYEIDDLKHGSFTYCLLQGVATPEVNTLGQLNEYLSARVPTLNVEKNKPVQKPYFIPNPADMQNLALFAAMHPDEDELDALIRRTTEFANSGQIDFDWWDKIIGFLESAKTGDPSGLPVRKAMLRRLLDGEMDFGHFKNRWRSAERATPSVRENKPQVRDLEGGGQRSDQ